MIDLLVLCAALGTAAFVIWCIHDSLKDIRWQRSYERVAPKELGPRLLATQRALGLLMPYICLRDIPTTQRRALRDAGVRVTLSGHPCPNTGIIEDICSCDLHGPIVDSFMTCEESDNGKE